MYLNKVLLIGNLTRDPEMRSLPSGVAVASFGLATNRFWKDKNGVKQEDTQFHNVVVFGAQADTTGRYLKKGQSALVEGRLQTRSWDGQDGIKKYRTEIVADRVQFGPKAGQGGQPGVAPVIEAGTGGDGSAAPEAHEAKGIDYPEETINPDDIPF